MANNSVPKTDLSFTSSQSSIPCRRWCSRQTVRFPGFPSVEETPRKSHETRTREKKAKGTKLKKHPPRTSPKLHTHLHSARHVSRHGARPHDLCNLIDVFVCNVAIVLDWWGAKEGGKKYAVSTVALVHSHSSRQKEAGLCTSCAASMQLVTPPLTVLLLLAVAHRLLERLDDERCCGGHHLHIGFAVIVRRAQGKRIAGW